MAHPRQKIWSKTYWDKNRDALNAKRREKIRKEQNSKLHSLIWDYNAGVPISDLCDKYEVRIRKVNARSV